MSSALDYLNSLNLPIIMSGDFNIDLLQTNDLNHSSIEFLDIMATSGFVPYISRVTRIGNNINQNNIVNSTRTLIDNIFINDLFSFVEKSGVLIDSPSDHFYTFISFDFKQNSRNKLPTYRYVRSMCQEKKVAFRAALDNIHWNALLSLNCPNQACDLFLEIFFDLYNIHFPIVKYKNNKNIHPQNGFMSKGLLVSRKRKSNS